MGRQRAAGNRAKTARGAHAIRVAPLFVCFLAGGLLTALALRHWGEREPGPPSESPAAAGEAAALPVGEDPRPARATALPARAAALPARAVSAPGAASEPAVSRLEALEQLLAPAARWRQRDPGVPMVWTGTLGPPETLVQWNARISAGVEALGLEILEGREEILTRSRGRPLGRLTLVVGDAGEILATIVVEAVRPPALPPAF